eukprot:1304385-Amphidinium_carterae.1
MDGRDHLLKDPGQEQGADPAIGFLKHHKAVRSVQSQFCRGQWIISQVGKPSAQGVSDLAMVAHLLEAFMVPASRGQELAVCGARWHDRAVEAHMLLAKSDRWPGPGEGY